MDKLIEPVDAINKLRDKENLIFVSGCFDIIHKGHIKFFKESKELFEDAILFVAIHDDESIKKKKGEDRPINKLDDRMFVLDSIKYIDYVMPWFGWEDIRSFVWQLKPGVISVTKGNSANQQVEQTVKDMGSRLHVVEFEPGFSTTNLMKYF